MFSNKTYRQKKIGKKMIPLFSILAMNTETNRSQLCSSFCPSSIRTGKLAWIIDEKGDEINQGLSVQEIRVDRVGCRSAVDWTSTADLLSEIAGRGDKQWSIKCWDGKRSDMCEVKEPSPSKPGTNPHLDTLTCCTFASCICDNTKAAWQMLTKGSAIHHCTPDREANYTTAKIMTFCCFVCPIRLQLWAW